VRIHFMVPGPLEQLTGGYLYDRQMVQGLRGQGWAVTVHELAGTFPLVDHPAKAAAAQAMALLPPGARVVIDGLALPACVEVLPRHAKRLYLVALIHHPLAAETGWLPHERDVLERLERMALALVHRVIVTSPYTAAALAAYGVTPDRIGIVEPGTAPAVLSQGSGGGPLALLCVATVIPRKGHTVLLEALATLTDLDWRLRCIGSLRRNAAAVAAVEAAIARHRLGARITLAGERPQEEVAAAYQSADVFVLASYYEGYGMVFAEALAHGLPIVSTTGGAIPTTVPATAGLLVPPGDTAALTRTLRCVISHPPLRQRLAAGARAARQRLTPWASAVMRFAAELARTGAA
jgi:glycosyltransferase involved in cell wall biosynthesis